MRRRIRDAAVICGVIAVLVSITWMGVLTIAEQTEQADISRSYATSQQLAKVFAVQVARTIDSIESLMDFAAYEILQHGSAEQLKEMSDAGALSLTPVVQIALVSPDGFTVATNTGLDPARTDLRDREHIRVHLEGKSSGLYVGAPVMGRVSGKWSIQLSRKIIDKQDNFVGIIVASLDPFYFERFWKDTVGSSQLIALMRSDGVVLTRSQNLQWALERGLSRPDVMSRIGESAQGRLVDMTADGLTRLAYFTRAADLPLVIFTGEILTHVVEQYSRAQRKFFLIGGALTLMLLALGGWLVSYAWRLRIEEQTAREADKAKSRFVAAMSHEIRTPLNALVGFTGLLRKTKLSDEQENYLRTLESSALTMRNIVSDILDLSSLEAGSMKIETAPFDLREILAELKSVTAFFVQSKPIEVALHCDDAVPRFVVGDGLRLNQALLNVCGNAAKFTQSGEVSIRVRASMRGQGAEWLVFEVSDTGPGISEATQAKLFTPFEQGEATGRLRAAGTGLGLAITKMLLGRMGGSISVNSVQGEGSTFVIEIPLKRCEEARPLASRDQPLADPDYRSLRILVVDDARSSRLLLRILLQKKGHAVMEAEDGVEALEMMQSHDFDIVFLDMQMPRLGGIEVANIVRGKFAGIAPIMIALTAQAQPEDKKAALEAGIAFYVTKPFQEDTVDQALRLASRQAPLAVGASSMN